VTKRRLTGADVIDYFPDDCTERSSPQLFVLGDSHATAYRPMFDQLSAEQGRVVRVYEMPGCPYVGLMEPMGRRRSPACLPAARAAMDEVLRLARPGDVVFLPSLRVPRLTKYFDAAGVRDTRTSGDEAAFRRSPDEAPEIAAAVEDASQWITPFLHAGLDVLFEAPKPIFPVPIFRCVDTFNRMHPHCVTSTLRSDQEAYRAPTTSAMRALASRYPAIRIWDPLPVLCDADHCDAVRVDGPMYFDSDHVSAYANYVLYPSFEEAVRTPAHT
jgi:hypothetical protein